MKSPKGPADSTLRPNASGLDKMLGARLPVLDHGFVRVVDYMGNDSAIVQAARVSYGQGTKSVREDESLIRYLMKNSHTSPFEMCELKLHVKLPIFVARQWIRHRTASVNEYSGRYSMLDREFYLPTLDDLRTQSRTNKQGRDEALAPERAAYLIQLIKEDSNKAFDHYIEMLNQNEDGEVIDPQTDGIARELARVNLSLNFYTQWYWKINLHNLLHFLRLRMDRHAQLEIREYAKVILGIVERWVPITYRAFLDFQLNGARFSSAELALIRRMISGERITFANSDLPKRDWISFAAALGLNE